MNCNKILKGSFSEEIFEEEIENTKKCIIKNLKITSIDFDEIENVTVFAKLDNRETAEYHRKLINFNQGTLDCYMSLEKDFIYIIHHPN